MRTNSFEIGDEVVLISDDSITYIILSIYGSGNSICTYIDRKTKRPNQLSIPLIALMKRSDVPPKAKGKAPKAIAYNRVIK